MTVHPRTLLTSALATLIAATTLTSATAFAGDGHFGPAETTGVPNPSSVAVGDFNGDGRPDFAVASVASGNAPVPGQVRVRLGAAGGGFVPAPNVSVGVLPYAVVVADFNSDGNDDLAVSNVGDENVNIRLGTGSGTFTSTKPDIALARAPLATVVGDFNHDNHEDLAISSYKAATGGRVSVHLGAGDGTFTVGGQVPHIAGSLAVGDFDSDMIDDLAYGAHGGVPGGSSGVLLGKGNGEIEFGAPIALPSQPAHPKVWAVGDFNADAKQDVAVALSGEDRVSVRLGTGDGKFSGGTDLKVGDLPAAVAIGDFDSDGREDLAVTNATDDSVSVRLGDGSGGFRAVPDVLAGDTPVEIALADFDSDGSDDLAVVNFEGSTVSVHRGLGRATLAGNLLVNGGFEGDKAAGFYRYAPASEIPGWERTGGMTSIRYGIAGHAFFPSRLAAPRYGTGGNSLLWGGNSSATGGVTTAVQEVDVSASAAAIDAGKATANLSAHLGGALDVPDTMTARAQFVSADGTGLGSFQIGPVTAADRGFQTTMLRRRGSAQVPAGTRRIRVTLGSDDDDRTYSSATADNVKLTLDAPPLPPAQAPGAGFGARTGVTLALAARRVPARGPVKVRVANANGFAIAGRLSGQATRKLSGSRKRTVKVKTRSIRLGGRAKRTVALKLPRELRRLLVRRGRLSLRLTAVVKDPGGRTRTVKKTVTPKLKRKLRRTR